MATDITTSEQGSHFDQHQIEWTLSLLGELAEKVRQQAILCDRLLRLKRIFWICLLLSPVPTTILLFHLMGGTATFPESLSLSRESLPPGQVPVSWAAPMMGILFGPFVTVIAFSSQIESIFGRSLAQMRYDLSVSVHALQRVLERVSQIAEFRPPEWEFQLQLDIRMSEAESALLLAGQVNPHSHRPQPQ